MRFWIFYRKGAIQIIYVIVIVIICVRYVPVFYNIVSGQCITVLWWGGKAVQAKNCQATIFSVDVQLKVHSFSNGKHNREVFLREWIFEADNKIEKHNHSILHYQFLDYS